MAREGVRSLRELSRLTGLMPETLYGWFRKKEVSPAAQSISKLVNVLGAAPGDPWFEEPTERTLDPETMALLDAAVERATDRLAERLLEFLDQRLPRTEHGGGA